LLIWNPSGWKPTLTLLKQVAALHSMVMGADGLYFDEIGQLKGIEHWKNIIKAQDE